MFRRVMIILISVLAMVFLALMLVHLAGRGIDPTGSTFNVKPGEHASNPHEILPVGPDGGAGAGLFEIHVRDRSGRLQRVIRARMQPSADQPGHADLVNPEVILFSDSGEQLRISSPHGFIDSQGGVIAAFEDIKRGRLAGGVTLRQDNGTPDDPSDDLVARTDHVDYDQQTARLYTDDPVTVRSPDQDVDAIGMVIYLFPGKTKLRELHLLKEVKVVLRRDGERFRMGFSPETAAGSTAPPTTPAPSAPGPAPSPAPTPAPRRPATAPTPTTPSEVASAGTAESAEAAALEANAYNFDLTGNVSAVQGESSLTGADRLILIMRSGSTRSSTSAPASAADNRLAVPSTASAASAASTSGSPAATAAQPAAAAASVAIPPPTPRPGVVPLNIVCDGPLIVKPVVDPREFYVHAVGREVRVVDSDIRTTSSAVEYDGSSQFATLTGAAGRPVVVLQGPNKVTGDVVAFNRRSGEAEVQGRGRLDSTASSTSLTGGDAQQPGEPFIATWTRRMNVSFVNRPVAPGTRSKPFLRWARFSGDAVLKQGTQSLAGNDIAADFFDPVGPNQPGIRKVVADGRVAVSQPVKSANTAVGDLACEYLVFDFVPTPDGRSRPSRLFARGDVVGTQVDGGIQADELTITFTPDPRDPNRSKATGLVADRNVRVRRGELYAEATHLETDETGDAVTLTGTAAKWATATQGSNKIAGPLITMVRPTQRVDVTGPGTLDLMTSRGIQGEALREPTPLHLAWKKSMFFDGQKNVAHFTEDARARMPSASVDCADLWVFFADSQSAAAPAKPAKASGPEATDRLFAGKTIVRVVAVDNVLARSVDVPADPAKELSVATIRGPKLEYDVAEAKAYVPGAGSLQILTVPRFPEARPPHERVPSSTIDVTWKKAMIFERARLLAWFGENVVANVTGRAGAFDAQGGKPSGPPGPKTLRCQDLRLFFAPAEGQGTASTPASPGRSMTLTQLVATTGVNFVDGDRHARATRITYDHPRQLVVLTGSPGAPAEIWQQSEQNQQYNRVTGNQISYHRDTGKAEIVGPQGITISPPDR